jgi:iron(III) transport system substrate-binding protein
MKVRLQNTELRTQIQSDDAAVHLCLKIQMHWNTGGIPTMKDPWMVKLRSTARRIRMACALPRCLLAVGGLWLTGCAPSSDTREVVIYTSLDRPHSAPVLAKFEAETGIRVRAVYDTEAAKTVGLVNRLLAEADSPQADVFWNNEVIRTITLKKRGVLAPYHSPQAKDIPSGFKDEDGYWTGFAARARVLLINTEQVSEAETPRRIADLSQPMWRGRFAIANPLFGTTGTHVAAWWATWGPERTREMLLSLRANGAVVTTGNATARDLVAAGEVPVCLTDTDDAYGAIRNGRPVRMVYPDQGAGEEGTLLIPNTVMLIRGGPNPEAAKRLIDYLLSSAVEEALAFGESAQVPVRAEVKRPVQMENLRSLHWQKVDYVAAAAAVDASGSFVRDEFIPRQNP